MYQVASLSSFILFLLDIVLAKKFSMPLNEQIRMVSTDDEPGGLVLQKDWIRWIGVRGNIALTGFAIMLITVVLS
ncbi:MAG: hypothetical protein EOO02_24235 [Chitinophagaceae bacterium]|nr:MAG: hypothetical protein EOO02_24235 [Chitinophagaceae bacterium]